MADTAPKPIQMHRIDPRMVHSTLLEAWVPYLGATRLVVVDHGVAHDDRRRIIFEMSARDVGTIHFVSEQEVTQLLSDVPPDEPTIVVYASLEGFALAVESGLDVRQVMVGHLPDGEERRRVHPSVYVGPDDLEMVERIRGLGVDVVVRPLPSDQALGLRRGEDERPVLTDDLPTPIPSSSPHVRAYAGSPAERSGHVEVVNERGLHLRAAHVLAQCAGRYTSQVDVGWQGRMVNAKSLLGITTLGAAKGSRLELEVRGDDADAAYRAVSDLFASGFEEGAE